MIDKLYLLGVILVASAGNYGDNKRTLFPASHSCVISVGALHKLGKPAATNPSHGVDVYAPGANIVTPLVGISDGVEMATGSSCATPAIAGLIALKIQFERNKCELLEEDDDYNYHLSEILEGEKTHLDDIRDMFKYYMQDGQTAVLNPCNYFRKECRLNIET